MVKERQYMAGIQVGQEQSLWWTPGLFRQKRQQEANCISIRRDSARAHPTLLTQVKGKIVLQQVRQFKGVFLHDRCSPSNTWAA